MIFLMFGPLLMAGVALAVICSIPAVILLYSLPIGLQTTAVLHANNTRDITTDRAAGTFTWAMRLGEDMAYRWHCFLFFTSYAAAFALGFAETPVPNLRVSFVFLCIPWALYVTRCFKLKQYAKLPQRIAQHNLMFGTILILSAADPMFSTRVLLGCLYFLGGVNNIMMWNYNREMVHMKLNNVLPGIFDGAKGLSDLAFGAAVVCQTASSAAFMLGIHPAAWQN